MKLIRIEFAGIGPFSGKETIDFTRFDDSGLFLLEGPTGAGKSTILDAITFALYGIVARGSDSTKDRLRSDHVPAKAKSLKSPKVSSRSTENPHISPRAIRLRVTGS